ncbi:MAG: tetratricopeptide repeat protein [Chloroflexi bacterium]|nr:MAG: tetratricopeptide repeat protein [Chloroflexota bacterium]
MIQKEHKELYGNFETIRIIEEGGMGTVYEARHHKIPTIRSAIKVIRPDYAEVPAFRQLFQVEAKIMAELGEDPGTVSIHDFGFNGGRNRDRLYIVMDFVEGENLGKRLHRLRANQSWLGLEEAIWLIHELCPAVQKAHDKNIWHLDLKAENIMLAKKTASEFGYQPILTDFGIAELKEAVEGSSRRVSGTPPYMSPEQAGCNSQGVDGRSDIYSLGIILFELTTGQLPFQIKTLADKHIICDEEPPQPTSIYPVLPIQLEEVILKALAKDPTARFQTVTEMDEALSELKPQIQTLPYASPVSTTITLLSDIDQLPPITSPRIVDPNHLLSEEGKVVLEKMFVEEKYKEVTVRRQFDGGLSGAYVYEVRPISHSTNEAHSVIKVAAQSVILREYLAYEQFIQKAEAARKFSLKCVKSIGKPIEVPELGLGWGGLRYSMAGDGEARVNSLHQYYLSPDNNIDDVLDKQKALLKEMKNIWQSTGEVQAERSYSVRKHFSFLLPVDLVVDCPNDGSSIQAPAKIRSDVLLGEFKKGDPVRVVDQQFILVKVDPTNFALFLRSPAEVDSCYTLRLNFQSAEAMQPYVRYQIGHLIPHDIQGIVQSTRADSFHEILGKVLGTAVNWQQAPYLDLPVLNKMVPNPWLALEPTLAKFMDGIRSGVIHGDLNLENVLIETPGDALYLIDFAQMRQDKVLHDFLTYESRIITKIVAELCHDEGEQLPRIIYDFYCKLDQETFKIGQSTISHDIPEQLKKPFELLAQLRDEAKSYITSRSNNYQYYLGLIVYLLGTLRFKDLDAMQDKNGRSIPKQTAFWAAAAVCDILKPGPQKDTQKQRPQVATNQPKIVGIAVFLLASCTCVACLSGLLLYFNVSPPSVILLNRNGTEISAAAKDEILILIFTFSKPEKNDTEPEVGILYEIQDTVDREKDLEMVRVELTQHILNDEGESTTMAREIGEQYNASIVIWGEDTAGKIRVNFLELKHPDFEAASVHVTGDINQFDPLDDYLNKFVFKELPDHLEFLSLFAVSHSHYLNGQYDQAINLAECGVDEILSSDARSLDNPKPCNDRPPLLEDIKDEINDLLLYGNIPEGLDGALFRLGWLYGTPHGDPNNAIIYYTQAISLTQAISSDNSESIAVVAYNNRGIAYYELEQHDVAIADYTHAIEIDPEFAFAFYNRGIAYFEKGQDDVAITDNTRAQAIADYTRATEIDPDFAFPYNGRGIVYYDLEQYDDAIADYNRAIEIDPEYAFAFYNRGIAYYQKGQDDMTITDYTRAQAIADYTRATEIDPDFALPYNGRGIVYYDLEQYDDAIADYNRAIEIDPDFALAYTGLAKVNYKLKRYDDTLADFIRAIESDPDNANAHNGLCWVGSLLGKVDEVMINCKTAVELAPEDEKILDSRGLARALTGDYEGAIEDFEKVVEWFETEYTGNDKKVLKSKREDWISILKAGENPFTAKVLRELLLEIPDE